MERNKGKETSTGERLQFIHGRGGQKRPVN